MADDIVIRAEGLGKKYLIGHRAEHESYLALRDVVSRGVQNAWRKAGDLVRGRALFLGDRIEEFWALKDVSFEVQRGEVLGIIGRNGAGKTTLLKILSRITEPSEGRVSIRGRVASLLEVGTGFHPELTGRENIFLNGSILGMTRAEIRKKFDEIVDFAEIEKFLDTPVKRYSSGMYVRLAFAVAAHLEPEILIVDEVLAVGDVEFQKKCLGKIDTVSRREGRTVLFVTHNLGVMATLCGSAMWLERGCARERGDPRTIVTEFLADRRASDCRIVDLTSVPRARRNDERGLRIEALEWRSGLPLRHGEPVGARIRLRSCLPVSEVSVGIGFSTLDGTRLLTYETDYPGGYRANLVEPGNYALDVEIASLPLPPDVYTIDIGCRSGDFHDLDYIAACLQISVASGGKTPGTIIRKGAGVRLPSEWSWQVPTGSTALV